MKLVYSGPYEEVTIEGVTMKRGEAVEVEGDMARRLSSIPYVEQAAAPAAPSRRSKETGDTKAVKERGEE